MAPLTLGSIRDRSKILLTRYPALYDHARRPYAVGRYWLGKPHDPDYAVFGLMPQETRPFLDVGANAGMSALSFRTFNRHSRIISVEPNPFHESDLRFVSRLAKPFEFHLWGAGETETTLTLHIPVYRGVPLTTEASLFPEEIRQKESLHERLGEGMNGPHFEIVAHEMRIRPLDVLELDPAYIKVDVEGAEHGVLLGLRATLERARPLLLIEEPDDDVRQLVGGLGYSAYSFVPERGEVIPEIPGRLNTVFVHDSQPVPGRQN